MKDKIYTSDEILVMDDLYLIQDQVASLGIDIKYQMTEGEIQWYHFIKGRYSIADYIHNNSVINENGFILTINSEISKYLDDDVKGLGKAVMLSDDTALQKIIFWVYNESYSEDLEAI